ncbi:ABC transporter family protein (macronuclear) [Tetrahymena thermophila SB210]|uniref:ABC transporter family protein n=1 Tax=Tetrahymena thermophila (strain SB210) TaxID=312017 RepID=I7LTR5_TETTS|nr:ABC transporter family protein [Tetrahymena thermophila SB210]EAR86008.2 ABC transporter family protein [Tetrahymena thermophila SB210]|eukprot:XP_976603.2 ABC transporter family protein [Tetrahymena thermophila SB210]
MGGSPSINANNEVNRQEKLQELNKISLPNCDINSEHKIMQLNMVCVDERCEFHQQLNPLCAQCLEEQIHKFPNHQNTSVPSILREIGNQALQSEKIKLQQKSNLLAQQRLDFSSGIASIEQNSDISSCLEGIIKSIECIKATCRILENNVRDVIRIYSETKNQILLNSNWNVICKQYESITQQPLTSQTLKKCLEELRYYCKIEEKQVLLFDLEKSINNYLEQDTTDYAKQMIGLCKRIEDMAKGAINLSKPQNFNQYKQDCLQDLKKAKQKQDQIRQNEQEQQNELQDSYYSYNQEAKQNLESYKQPKQSVSPQKRQLNSSHIDYQNNSMYFQQKMYTSSPQRNNQHEREEEKNIFKDSNLTYSKQIKTTQAFYKEQEYNQRNLSPQRENSQLKKMQQTEPQFISSKRMTHSQLTDYIAQERQG